MPRALTMLNEQGDVTVAWTEERDAEMIEIIRKKMAAGIVFFIIEPRMGGLLPPSKKPLKKAEDARKYRALSIRDEDFRAFTETVGAELVPTPDVPVKAVRRAKTPEEVATSESVGVAQNKGG